ncbi:hypothetical protein chiPu_0032435, partial [Chiloscyllium punctatum]|nr:hypothetical protein [Chiloscyllium punctatum]
MPASARPRSAAAKPVFSTCCPRPRTSTASRPKRFRMAPCSSGSSAGA